MILITADLVFFAMVGFNDNTTCMLIKNMLKHSVFGGPIFTHY